jgi:hypothetical protein
MSNVNTRETLDQILADLKSGVMQRALAAIHELETINFSSEAILIQLERLALEEGEDNIRSAALHALSLRTSQHVASKQTAMSRSYRALILDQIEAWIENGLIEEHRAEVIKRHYDFDLQPGIPARPAGEHPAEEPKRIVGDSQLVQADVSTPAPIASLPPAPPQPKPAEPRPSITQILLSETSIRIYLFLGAFFVIASAAILAAVIEAARLPILLAATMIFAGGAVGLKKRLPQPSFALAVVFSFLLPIDANVIADSLNLSLRGNDYYWAGILILMTGVWSLGTWFYESRMFSLASFLALLLGVLKFDNAIALSNEWAMFSIGIANMIGLIATRMLQSWKDKKFAQPLFITAQGLQVIVLLVSFTFISINLFESDVSSGAWIAHSLTWLFSATFFVASDLLFSFALFPWMAVISLFLVPGFFLAAFDAPATTQIFGFGIWGAIMALASEFIHGIRNKTIQKYSTPLLTISLPLFGVSILWGLIENVQHAFVVLLSGGVVLTFIHILRARWYVWSIALLSWLGAYFLFFTLPFMQKLDVYFGYQLLIASVVALIPGLFSKQPLTFARSWNWPLVMLGILLVFFNLFFEHLELLDSDIHFGRAAITLGIYAILFAAYALRFKQPVIGYLSTTSLALTIVYGLIHFDLDLWLPSLVALSIIYYFVGYFIHGNDQNKAWGAMLVNSGLALGAICSAIALFTLKRTGGWYIVVVGALFVTEMFKRRNGRLELLAAPLFSSALILILNDFNVQGLSYYLFGLSLIWLAGDAILHLTFKERLTGPATKEIGAIIAVLFVAESTINNGLASSNAAIVFAVYTVFAAAYAFIYKNSTLGYLSTASAAVTMFYALDHFNIEAWLPIFTGLSLTYYLAGFLLQKKSADWSEMLRYSGLGLGSIVSLTALVVFEPTGGWYAGVIGVLFAVETVSTQNGRLEAGIHGLFSAAAFLILQDFAVVELSYILLALSLVWLGGDVILHKTFKERQIATPVRLIGGGIATINALALLNSPSIEATVGFGVYAIFFAAYGYIYNQPLIGYISTVSLPLAVSFGLRSAGIEGWLFPEILVASVYYAIGFSVRRADKSKWEDVLIFSGLGLGTLTALAAPYQSGGIEKAIPIAIAATLFAVEAFYLRNVWLAFPANGLYLISYFTLLTGLNVDEPQYFSIGAALLGMLMHYLLLRADSKTGAFIMGVISQLVLLGTSYVQLISTSQVGFFFVLFFQSLVIIFYGLYMRSRSLVFAPIAIVVLGTLTILYSALRNLSLVIFIGASGIILLTLGILAVLMRERITAFVERFSEWNA